MRKAFLTLFPFQHQEFRYLFVGGLNTVLGIVTFPLLYWLFSPLGFNYIFVLIVSYLINTLVAFSGQKYIVFRTKGNHIREFSKYGLFQLANLGINIVILPILISYTGWGAVWSQILISICLTVTGYFFHKFITFK